MKISIITCTRNSAATLGDTLASVRTQRHADLEHIFVDGDSTDGTLEMIAAACPDAIVLRGVTGGISRAMNAGAAVATGEVISHLHSDDFYADDDVLRRVTAALQETRAQWLVGRIETLSDGIRRPLPRGKARFTPERYARGSVAVHHPAVFLRRDLFAGMGGFDETLRYAMDIDLWFRIGRQHAPVELESTLAVFRVHAGSLSTAQASKAREEEWQVRLRYWRSWPVQTALCKLRHWRMALRASMRGEASA